MSTERPPFTVQNNTGDNDRWCCGTNVFVIVAGREQVQFKVDVSSSNRKFMLTDLNENSIRSDPDPTCFTW